ncbi:MAG: DUF1571 domain-containing protein [Candidatus Lernaella stagnicola]|nr:DUF1571 domain-containing protein [Candidatus Lernaella stagnicola]
MVLRTTCFSTALLLLIGLLIFAASATADEDPLTTFKTVLAKAEQSYARVKHFEGEIEAQERVKGKLNEKEFIHFLIVKESKSFAYQWHKGGRYNGLVASHIAERDGEDKFRAIGTGKLKLIGVQHLGYYSYIVDKFYPHHFRIHEYGIGFLLGRMIRVHKRAEALAKLSVTDRGVVTRPSGAQVHLFETRLSPNAADGLEYSRTILGFSPEHDLPLLTELYDFEGRLHSRYEITELTLNGPYDQSAFDLK